MAFVDSIFLIRIYKITPRKISSSNKTDLIFHQIHSNDKLEFKAGLMIQAWFVKTIFMMKPEAQHNPVMIKNKIK